jgi:hypothetical protein
MVLVPAQRIRRKSRHRPLQPTEGLKVASSFLPSSFA